MHLSCLLVLVDARSLCYPLEGALRDRLILVQLRTPDQCGPVRSSPVPQDFTRSDPFLGEGWDPLGLIGILPLSDSSAADEAGIPPVLPLDILLYSTSFIRPQMVGEMGLFHDRPISLLLVPFVPGPSPTTHLSRVGLRA
jgi:hypothetical protein